MDLYYDPVADEHVGRGPMGIMAPAWYFSPQRPDVALAGWNTAAQLSGALGSGPIAGLEDPGTSTMLLQFSGEFAEPDIKRRIWEAADQYVEPTWDLEAGEFTLGFGLGEAHPRGQWNARAMAGWVCTKGAWARIFNQPNLTKFAEPTVEGVDFPNVALSEAWWDGDALHVAAQPCNSAVAGSSTTLEISNPGAAVQWLMTSADGATTPLTVRDSRLKVALPVDNRAVVVRPV